MLRPIVAPFSKPISSFYSTYQTFILPGQTGESHTLSHFQGMARGQKEGWSNILLFGPFFNSLVFFSGEKEIPRYWALISFFFLETNPPHSSVWNKPNLEEILPKMARETTLNQCNEVWILSGERGKKICCKSCKRVVMFGCSHWPWGTLSFPLECLPWGFPPQWKIITQVSHCH